MNKLFGLLRNTAFVIWVRGLLPNRLVNVFLHLPKAVIANLVFSFPARKLTVIGVTGTKGKTTTAHLIYHILRIQKKSVVLVSTIGAFFGEKQIDTGLHVTNPQPFTLQRLLKQAVDERYEYAVLEVTSHGLEQFRNWGIPFTLGVFTQVTADHVAYHGGPIEYRKVKLKLIKASKKVILNELDPSIDFLVGESKRNNTPQVLYKKNKGFASQNREAAITSARELGISREKSRKALRTFPGVPGRMEEMAEKPFAVVIDFAHTPDSLEAALNELRPRLRGSGRLIAVFGCAGERDPGRRRMGAVAARLADYFIITAEDPRREGVEKISEEIASYAVSQGAKEILPDAKKLRKEKTRKTFSRIPVRQKAIETAIRIAQPGDVIGLFGKGHEKSMCFGTKEHPWSEHDAVRKALRKREKL